MCATGAVVMGIIAACLCTAASSQDAGNSTMTRRYWINSSSGLTKNMDFWGVALGDINNDGHLDIAGANHNNTGVFAYLGDGAGHWTQTPQMPIIKGNFANVIMADYDSDGKIDIIAGGDFIPSTPGCLKLFKGDGTGHWTDVTNASGLNYGKYIDGLAMGDVNKDGIPDLIIASGYGSDPSNGIHCFIQKSDHTFAQQSSGLPTGTWRSTSVCIADFNKDGSMDVAFGGRPSPGVYFGNGGAGGVMSWSAGMTSGLPSGDNIFTDAITGDVNKDGWPDLILSSYHPSPSHGIKVLLNQNGASWTDASAGLPGEGKDIIQSALGDFDKDGNLDLAVGFYYEKTYGIKVYYGDGGTNWTLDSPALPTGMGFDGIAVGDINSDGYPDIAAGFSTYGYGLQAWFNSGVPAPEFSAHLFIPVSLCLIALFIVVIKPKRVRDLE